MQRQKKSYADAITLDRVDRKARMDLRLKIFGLISLTQDKCIENCALARAIGMDPRGLRSLLRNDQHFRPVIRESGRGLWWFINPDHPKLQIDHEAPPAEVLATGKTSAKNLCHTST